MGAERVKAEYEDIAALAKELNLSLETVRKAVRNACR